MKAAAAARAAAQYQCRVPPTLPRHHADVEDGAAPNGQDTVSVLVVNSDGKGE